MESPIPRVKLSRFEGPLDLLLYLIRQQEIDIHDIPINEITHQFLGAIDQMREMDLEVAGEFILMVAYLLYIKAQMLLPQPATEEDEDPRMPLVQKLLEYQKFKQIGEELGRMEDERKMLFPRGFDPSKIGVEEIIKADFSAYDLYKAYIEVAGYSLDGSPTVISGAAIDIEEKLKFVREKLLELNEISFNELTKGEERLHLVAIFIALLELAKRGFLAIKQAKPFGIINLQYTGDAND
jgi:segregation and condensation protein A